MILTIKNTSEVHKGELLAEDGVIAVLLKCDMGRAHLPYQCCSALHYVHCAEGAHYDRCTYWFLLVSSNPKRERQWAIWPSIAPRTSRA